MNFCDGESVREFYCLFSSLQNGELLGTMETGVILLPKLWVALMNYFFRNVLKEFVKCKGFVILMISNMPEASGLPLLFSELVVRDRIELQINSQVLLPEA